MVRLQELDRKRDRQAIRQAARLKPGDALAAPMPVRQASDC